MIRNTSQLSLSGNIIDGYKAIKIDKVNNKILFRVDTPSRLNDPAYRKEIKLEFEVNKENDVSRKLVLGDFANVVEITEYTTALGGLIDRDSAPGNADVVFDGDTPKIDDTKYEDDTDEAKGINILLNENKRKIEGTVWDDSKNANPNGILEDEDKINDVIVQLIEIKKISGGEYCEYIWQETRSGSNTVKTADRNGYNDKEYTVEKEDGKYEFTDYIAGNYIIRFIYGDGSTYDVTENVKTYNGQDYKSTIDKNYKAPWYNTAGYSENESKARDNEARRLEVMAYSTIIDNNKGEKLQNKSAEALENTWMCAETSRIEVPVDAKTEDLKVVSSDRAVDFSEDPRQVTFGNINFGLAERPKTKLVLEKHITALKITPNGVGVQPIIDAKSNDIKDIINGTNVTTTGINTGLATIKSTRNNRGFWYVATDIEELAQGAELEVEYTYVVRNDGEKDYLSSELVSNYSSNPNTYATFLTNTGGPVDKVRKSMKNGNYSYNGSNNIGTYLGQYYYNGVESGCAEVPSRVETIEEALNNDLIFDNTLATNSFQKNNNAGNVDKLVYDVNGTSLENKSIKTVIESKNPTKFLNVKDGEKYIDENISGTIKTTADWNKKVKLTTVLSSISDGELGANLPSYIAEITKYSNAAGRRDVEIVPGNLEYVHSNDSGKTLVSAPNEHDEFWAESIIIGKPTGEDKLTPIQIAIIVTTSIAVIGIGIILIKKYVIRK